jgi:hypothetical protein
MSQALRFSFTRRSGNKKIGPMPAVTISANTCPKSCELRNNGCYAEDRFVKYNWRKLDDSNGPGISLTALVACLRSLPQGQVWRYAVAGDLPGRSNRIDRARLATLVKAASHTRGFTYTHKPVLDSSPIAEANRDAVKKTNSESGLTINLSAKNPAEADAKALLGIGPVVVTVPSTTRQNFRTPAGNLVMICLEVTRGIQCIDCKVCWQKNRKYFVGFPAHGNKKSSIDRRLSE